MNPTGTQIYRIVKDGDRFVTVQAELVGKSGSWWHVKHADGSITKHNGGGMYHDSIFSAWSMALNASNFKLGMLFWRGNQDPSRLIADEPTEREYRDTLMECMWDEAYQYGVLYGHILGSQGKPLPNWEEV